MNRCTNPFPSRTFFICLAFLAAGLAFSAVGLCAQTPAKRVDPYQKISFKTETTCTVPADGEVTALVKNGVELSVTEDFDCDGVPDAYDNCVGMPNRDQADSNGNGIGDVCEAATIVKTGLPVKMKVKTRDKRRETRDKRRETRDRKREFVARKRRRR